MKHEIRTEKDAMKLEIEQRRKREEKLNQAGIEKDRANGFLVGFESNEWKKKQEKLIEGFLSSVTESVFEVSTGSVAKRPLFKNAQEWIESIRADFEALKTSIDIPSKLIKAGKVNADPFAQLREAGGGSYRFKGENGAVSLCQSRKVAPVIIEAMDPPFDIPKGKTVYECKTTTGIVFYVLTGSTLTIATNAGEVIIVNQGYEGAKAKAKRLEAEEAERKRLEEIERKKQEAEAEERRQASQLEKLKALPDDKFEKLMNIING